MTDRYRITVVAHDAGGANVLAALARKYRDDFDWRFAVAGPALQIAEAARFERIHALAGGGVAEIAGLLAAAPADLVLTGTGWAAELERDGIRAARRCGVPVASYLDHWVNYRQRFAAGAGWRAALPDAVLVGDGHARDQALRDGFPAGRLVAVENPYLAAFFARPGAAAPVPGIGHAPRLLFLSEPVGAAPFGAVGPGAGLELRLAEALVAALGGAGAEGARLSIRLHPSEPPDKYAALLGAASAAGVAARVEAHPAAARALAEDCAAADRVVGVASMALLAAAALGRPTYSYRGDGAEDLALPHGGILPVRGAAGLAGLLAADAPPAAAAPFDARLFTEPFVRVVEGLLARCHEPCR